MDEEKNEFAVGDLVVVIAGCEYYNVGDIGVVEATRTNELSVDFNSRIGQEVVDDGHWYCYNQEIKHYTLIEDLPLWKANHQYLNNEQQQALRKLLHRVQWDEEYAEKIHFKPDETDMFEVFVWLQTDEGFDYWIDVAERCLEKKQCIQDTEASNKPDGGSSDYYKLQITRVSDGETFDCEMGDIIYSVFGGDFDLGNIVKACRRAYLDSIGKGKDGAPIKYDMNKIKWFADDFNKRTEHI